MNKGTLNRFFFSNMEKGGRFFIFIRVKHHETFTLH